MKKRISEIIAKKLKEAELAAIVACIQSMTAPDVELMTSRGSSSQSHCSKATEQARSGPDKSEPEKLQEQRLKKERTIGRLLLKIHDLQQEEKEM
ncbi:hypothetical protein SEUCBS139899_006154 [Sporothrix eucalyptigena]|uniref:Uncharacterized protein n=1 Tax=Sporothrix eucalyptigena TaxID=1812306 RepID=A0ABP0AQL6_9PEZI